VRPLELLLLIADGLAATLVLLRLRDRAARLTSAAVVAPLVAVLQVAVEGPRWQLFPGYVLSVLVAAAGLRLRLRLRRKGSARAGRRATATAVSLVVPALAVSAALPLLLPVWRLPPPTGPHAIGTVTFHWTDATRPEIFTTGPAHRREIVAHVWYPAPSHPSARPSPYLPDADVVMPALARLMNLPPFLLNHFRYVTTHAADAVPVADAEPTYPVLLFLTGLNGFAQSNMFQVEDLVSHGYVVVALDQPGASAAVRLADGTVVIGASREQRHPLVKQVLRQATPAPTLNGRPMPDGITPYLAQDVSFAIDRLSALDRRDAGGLLSGRLDLTHLGLFGVSLGALTTAEACAHDLRLKACLMMEVFMPADVVRQGLTQPAMWMTRDAASMRLEHWSEADIAEHLSTMRSVYAKKRSDAYFLQFPGMFHIGFTDAPLWSPVLPRTGLSGVRDLADHPAIEEYTLAFFERYISGTPQPLLTPGSNRDPGVIVESR